MRSVEACGNTMTALCRAQRSEAAGRDLNSFITPRRITGLSSETAWHLESKDLQNCHVRLGTSDRWGTQAGKQRSRMNCGGTTWQNKLNTFMKSSRLS